MLNIDRETNVNVRYRQWQVLTRGNIMQTVYAKIKRKHIKSPKISSMIIYSNKIETRGFLKMYPKLYGLFCCCYGVVVFLLTQSCNLRLEKMRPSPFISTTKSVPKKGAPRNRDVTNFAPNGIRTPNEKVKSLER